MDELLSIREFGADAVPTTAYPSFDESGTLLLFAEEAILCQRSAYRPTCFQMRGVSSDRLWALPAYTTLTITNRRLVFSCPKYNVDDEWEGWGVTPVGLALGALARVVRGFSWAKKRRGTTAAGHVLFEWPVSVGLGGKRTSDWTRLYVRWRDDESELSLDLPLGTLVSREMATLLTSAIARYRLANRRLLHIGDDAADLLNQQAVEPVESRTAGGSEYVLPGYARYPATRG